MDAYRDDIASDFSVYHRIRDIGSMRSCAFTRLAKRIYVYNGAVTARARGERHPQEPQAQQPRRSAGTPQGRRQTPLRNDAAPATASALAEVNAFMGGGWISHRVLPAAASTEVVARG